MGLRVVGAGLGRTGTHSLKLALEQLLGGRCYHMLEVFGRPDDIPVWHQAVRGEAVDWNRLFEDYVAAVDWPVGAFWREVGAVYPDAIVLLSVRADSEAWWRSAQQTIWEATMRPQPPEAGAWHAMVLDLLSLRFTPGWQDERMAVAAYERHNERVRAGVAPSRLVEWRPGDGWEPICRALGLPVPDQPFPHVNTTAEFRAMLGLDAPPDAAPSHAPPDAAPSHAPPDAAPSHASPDGV